MTAYISHEEMELIRDNPSAVDSDRVKEIYHSVEKAIKDGERYPLKDKEVTKVSDVFKTSYKVSNSPSYEVSKEHNIKTGEIVYSISYITMFTELYVSFCGEKTLLELYKDVKGFDPTLIVSYHLAHEKFNRYNFHEALAFIVNNVTFTTSKHEMYQRIYSELSFNGTLSESGTADIHFSEKEGVGRVTTGSGFCPKCDYVTNNKDDEYCHYCGVWLYTGFLGEDADDY